MLKTPEDLVYTPNVPGRRGAWGTGELETAGGEGLSTGSKDSFQVKAPSQPERLAWIKQGTAASEIVRNMPL